jgi:photosystem II stability/assembly factor-like uncharacterized protein
LLWLYGTQDGGATWNQQDLQLPEEMQGRPVSTDRVQFFGEKDAMLSVTARCSDTEACISFFHSTDEGRTWRGTAPLRYAVGRFVYAFVTPDQGVATDGTKVYTTADGGKRWTVSLPNVSLAGVTTLNFATHATGWARTESQVLKTTDGGLTWIPVVLNMASHR